MALSLLLTVVLMTLTILEIVTGGEVSLTQETPCVTGQGCRLKCSLVAGNLVSGFHYRSGSDDIAQCSVSGVCISSYPRDYTASLEDSRTSYLDIRSFTQLNVRTWSCSDGHSGRASSIQVVQNVLPSGVLTLGSSCQSGRVTSPASLSCSGLSPGVPPASLLLKDSSNQTVGSNQTGSVTGTVTRGGQASCSVSWSALPSYTLNISPVQCNVQAPPSVTRVTSSPLTVREGQSVTLICEATGSSAPSFSWSRSEAPVSSGSRSSLTFTPDRNTQTVTCTASNSGGQDSATFTLTVQYLPPGAPVLSPGGVVNEGDDVTLTCQVIGGNPPVSSVTLTCPRHSNTSQGDVTRLQFTADRRDQGSCVCSASHVLGYTQTASVNIPVYWSPTSPTDLQAVAVTSHSVTLTWLTGDTGNAQERWYQVHFRQLLDPGGAWEEGGRVAAPGGSGVRVGAVVSGLAPLTPYVIRVMPRNSDRDNVNSSAEIVEQTDEKVPVPVQEGLGTGAVIAVTAVVTLVLCLAFTLALVYILLHRRQAADLPSGSKSTNHQNVAFSGDNMQSNPQRGENQEQLASFDSPQLEQADYSDLDPASRDLPRPPAIYQPLGQPGTQGNLQSRDHGSHASPTSPGDGLYSNVADT